MPQEDDDASEMDHRQEVPGVILITDDESSEVMEPGKETLNFPSQLDTPQRSSVLGKVLSICSVRSNQLNFPFAQEACIEKGREADKMCHWGQAHRESQKCPPIRCISQGEFSPSSIPKDKRKAF